jgi:hypothetical protein
MRAYKRLNKSDVIVSPYKANKQWKINNTDFSSSNINIYEGVNYNIFDINGPLTYDNQFSYLIYKSAEHLYYNNFISGSVSGSFINQNGIIATSQSLQSGSYYNFPQSTTDEYRYFPTESYSFIYTIGIPRDLYGSKIKPGTFLMTSSLDYAITEDGKGNLYLLDSSSLLTWDDVGDSWDIADWDWDNPPTASNFSLKWVGNIIYPQGMLLFTTQSNEVNLFLNANYGTYDLHFKNEHIVYENVIKCTINESEFNYSQNPSTLDSGSNIIGNVTGSEFTPFVTTIGLYNDSQDLLMVAKLAQPVPLSTNTNTTFILNFDK